MTTPISLAGVSCSYEYIPMSNINWDTIDTVIHFTIMPQWDGTLNTTFGVMTPEKATEIVNAAHQHNKKVIITIGGDGSGGAFGLACTWDSSRALLINNIVNYMNQYGYDGVDIDWESIAFTPSDQGAMYVQFIKELRAKMNAVKPGSLLTASTESNRPDVYSQLINELDWFDAMLYNETRSSLNSLKYAMNVYLNAGVPASKIGIGYFDSPDTTYVNDLLYSELDYIKSSGFGRIFFWEMRMGFAPNNPVGQQHPFEDAVKAYLAAVPPLPPLKFQINDHIKHSGWANACLRVTASWYDTNNIQFITLENGNNYMIWSPTEGYGVYSMAVICSTCPDLSNTLTIIKL